MLVYGITGSIATGKSTVTNYLIDNGYKVVDSDKLAYDALTIDELCIEKTREVFNLPKGKIDRKELGKIIFNDDLAKKKLEDIIHPYVINNIKRIIKESNEEIIFLDIPLLFECNLEYLCDKIICVYVNRDIEIKRLMKRDNIELEYAKTILCNQINIEEKKMRSDIILDNSNSIDDLYHQIDEMLKGR